MLEPSRRRFTVDEYYAMARAGILREEDRVELIDGEIIEMNAIGPLHAGSVKRLNALFARRFGDVSVVSIQDPVGLGKRSEPQPDVVLLKPRADYYTSTHPTPDDVLLLVEVADSSVVYDRRVKAPLYARAGIREYWLVDLGERHVTVYRDPSPKKGYGTVQVLRRGERVSPLAFADRGIDMDEILG